MQSQRRIWLAADDRLKVEITHARQMTGLGLLNGTRWWRWTAAIGGDHGDLAATESRALPPVLDPPVLTPARLLGWLRLADVGAGQRAGRDVLTAVGWPRPRSPAATKRVRYELEFDAEHGTVVRMAAYDGAQPVQVTEATHLAYGCELDPSLFTWPSSELVEGPGADVQRDGALVPPSPSGAGARLLRVPTIWLTGLPGSGKTTVARSLQSDLASRGLHTCVLDGDELRTGLSSDLGMSRADRAEQARRVAHVAAIVAARGVVPIVALVSPFAEDRDRARMIHERAGIQFLEVWVNTPAQVCEARDPKGLYARAAAGRLSGLTGRDAPYEPPPAPELEVSGWDGPPEVAAARIATLISGARDT
ncbi:MAG: adenylyl-sulfate kinase [Solirubrobacteraceae bacterium]